MKKVLFFIVCIFVCMALISNAEETKKIYNIKKAYVFLKEALLVSDTDLNCAYFIRDKMPQGIKIIGSPENSGRGEFSDQDSLVINKGAKDKLKEGDLLMIMSQGRTVRNPVNGDGLGHYFLRKSLAEITCLYDRRAVIQLKNGCHPVNIGDFAVPFKPEKTVFEKKINYQLCRIPTNAVSGYIVFTDLVIGIPGLIVADTQYVSVDLGKGLVAKGTSLLIYRMVKSDLPPLIVGLGIVVHSENTNSTVKILDSSSPINVKDRVLVLPAAKEISDVTGGESGKENIPIVETLKVENQEKEAAQAGEEVQPGEQKGGNLIVDVLFDFDSKLPNSDHSADYAAIKNFIETKSEYLVTLRGYTCSIGSEEYNLRLAKERVEAIKNILISQYGLDAAHIEAYFYGEKEAQFDNSSEVERRKNRLVKIEVSGK